MLTSSTWGVSFHKFRFSFPAFSEEVNRIEADYNSLSTMVFLTLSTAPSWGYLASVV
jgi:hypothetical protein